MKDNYSKHTPFWTHSDTYGEFNSAWKRSYITHLPAYTRKHDAERMLRKIPTTSSEYGVFYESKGFLNGKAEYAMNTSFLPDIKLGHAYNPQNGYRKSREVFTSRDSIHQNLHLPDVTAMDVQFTTNATEAVTLYTGKGGLRHMGFPAGVKRLELPTIRNINIKLRTHDGGVLNIAAVPQQIWDTEK